MGKTAIAIRAFVALCVLSSSTLASWQPADIEGRWLGTIDTSLAYVPVLLKMTRTADGYSATLNATRLRAVLVKGNWVEFDMNVRSQDRERWTRFKGTFDEQRMKITGTIPGIPVPIVFVRDDRPAAKPGIDVQVPEGPTAFRGRGQTHLVYELRIRNSGPNHVEVKRIEVLGDSPLAIFAGGALKQLLSAVPGRDSRAIPITRDTVNGNFISLDMGNERYAMYMHLQPGSFRVRMGERVIRGQVLALVGNSGNTTGPHLHFQVVDRNSPFESQGVPYAIDSFEVVGKGQKYERRDNQLPMAGDKVRFN